LFSRFFRAHDARHASGLGLGLYISRQIIERHGGQIEAEFPSDGGLCVHVRIPR
jgi:signal transduction histidine kinase